MKKTKKTNIKFHIIAIISIIIFCFAVSPRALQNDTFYTIKIGEHIIQNKSIDMKDPFSWHEDLPYTYPHWAYDVFIYLVYNIGGMEGIYMSTIFFSCILGLAIYYTQCKLSKNKLTSFLLTIGVMCLLRTFIAARAQLVTFILFVFTIYFIEKFLQTKKKRYAIGLIIIPTIIANIHLAVWPFFFILFLPYIAEYLLSIVTNFSMWIKLNIKLKKHKIKTLNDDLEEQDIEQHEIEKIKAKQEKIKSKIEKLEVKCKEIQEKQENYRKAPYRLVIEKNNNVKYLILIMIICAFTGLLTPLGDTPYTYLYNTMQGNTTKNINEHLPMVLIESKYMLCVIGMFLAILIFTDTKITLRDLLMLGGLIILTLMSKRQFSMFVLICSYILNRLICQLFNKYDPKGTEKMIKYMTKVIGIIATLAIIGLFSWILMKDKIHEDIVNPESYPVEAAKFIKENLDVNNIRLYNEYNYGSYLLYQGIPVFIDSRADLYAPEFNGGRDIFTDFINISSIGTYYENKFKEYKITHLIMYKDAKLNMFISRNKDYKELYKDKKFVVYERLVKDD